MRALLACLVTCSGLLSATFAAQAEDAKPIRVIPITRESAEASVALIKGPQIGRPPIGRTVRQAEALPAAAQQKNWKDARAEVTASGEQPASRRERAFKRVEIWKPTASGSFAIQAYSVPASDAMANGY